jgi:CBS domain-containing protein
MKVREIMSSSPITCHPETDLAAAAMMMWDGDCGILPIVTQDQKLRGVITDRDICIALGSRHRRAEEMTVQEVSNGVLFSCRPEDDVHQAMETMGQHQIRRLPVMGPEGNLIGMLSINDLALAVGKWEKGRKAGDLKAEEVLKTFQDICQNIRSKKQKKGAAAA